MGRKIALDLPKVLEDLGAQINRDNELQEIQDESLLKKFKLRPKKYEGREIIIEIMFSGRLRSVDIDTSNCLYIKAGDANIYRVKIKLLYGCKKSVEWGPYDLVEKYEEETGLLLMDTPSYVGKNMME